MQDLYGGSSGALDNAAFFAEAESVALIAEKDALIAEKDALIAEKDALIKRYEGMLEENTAALLTAASQHRAYRDKVRSKLRGHSRRKASLQSPQSDDSEASSSPPISPSSSGDDNEGGGMGGGVGGAGDVMRGGGAGGQPAQALASPAATPDGGGGGESKGESRSESSSSSDEGGDGAVWLKPETRQVAGEVLGCDFDALESCILVEDLSKLTCVLKMSSSPPLGHHDKVREKRERGERDCIHMPY